MNPRVFAFSGGSRGEWSVLRMSPVAGDSLTAVERLDVSQAAAEGALWVLRGATSNLRYTSGVERERLLAVQESPGRAEATRAALIPIQKSAEWWNLPQDERRAIMEETSRHISIGLKYLPAISRRLHHCRDLNEAEPFDFLTWFDYAPEHSEAFEDLVGELRATEEWEYVEREVDIRLAR